MANIVQRLIKGRSLTFKEHDDNFNNLNAELATKASTVYVNSQITTIVNNESINRIASSEKAAPNGVATLDASGLVPSTQLPSYVDDVLEYANLATFPTIGLPSKIYVAVNTNKTYRWSGSMYVYITSGAVDSVAGKTGVITLVKADVGLGSVDNTSDAAKPISTAQAAAIGLKADIANPAFTGIPSAPTAAVGTSTTQLATTAFVSSSVSSSVSTAINNEGTPKSHIGSGDIAHAAVTTTVAGFMTAADKVKLDSVAGGAQVNVGTNLTLGTQTGSSAVLNSSTGSGLILPTATTTLAGLLDATDKVKLDSITAGAGGGVTSILGRTGDVTITKADIGLSNVDNTADISKPVSNAQANAIALKANIASPALTGIPTAPTAGAGTNSTQLATTAFVSSAINNDTTPIGHVGSVGISHGVVTSLVSGFMSSSDKVKLDGIAAGAGGGVTSVAGKSGAVTLVKADVGLDLVDNTPDISKPLSIAQTNAIALKANIASPTLTGVPAAPTATVGTSTTQLATTAFVNAEIASDAAPITHVGTGATAHAAVTTTVAGFMTAADKVKLDGIAAGAGGGVTSVAGKSGAVTLVKADVGLGSVDNTTDAAKPVSTAQATAIALKADIASPTLTGVPAAPTAAVGTSTTQLATTAFVNAEIASDAAPITHVGSNGIAHGIVTTSINGFMTAADKVKLDGIAAGAGGGVTSVAGKSGVVTLVKADVGLGSVDNTTDATKPVSTAQQTALNLKANLVSPALTGIPTAPTATIGTNTIQVATTAFVGSEIASVATPIAHVGTGATAHAAVTTTVAGFMSAADKVKLDGVSAGANISPVTSVAGKTGVVALTVSDISDAATVNLIQNIKSSDYTCVLSDAGKHILHPSTDAVARTFTIPSNAAVPYVLGTVLTFINHNSTGNITISINSDVLRLVIFGTVGPCTIEPNRIATAIKVTATEWLISGNDIY